MLKIRVLIFLILICLVFAFLIWSNLWTLTIFLILIFDSITTKFILRFIKKRINSNIYSLLKYVWFFTALIFTAIFFRVFFFEIYFIPSASMEATLKEGDIIIAEKLSFGPTVPNSLSEVPFGNIFFKNDTIRKPSRQLKGVSRIQRNDIILFKKFNGNRTYIKRVIGLPNDSLKILNSKVFINNDLLAEDDNYTYEYRYKNNNINKDLLLLTNREYQKFNSKEKIERNIYPNYSKVDDIFPKEKIFDWNRDNYGDVWIPNKGKYIILNEKTFLLYKQVIEQETNKKVKYTDGGLFLLGNKEIKKYTFKSNWLYF